jgi:hypothetical protein
MKGNFTLEQVMKSGKGIKNINCVWNVMAHAQKPDFLFRRNGRAHLNRQGPQFSRLLAAEVCASAVVMLDTPCFEVVWRVLATHSTRQFALHFPCRASPCAITFQLDSSNDGCTIFRGSVKSTGYTLHSPFSPSILLPASPCAITFQLDSSNDGCTMFRGSVKSTGYTLHSPFSPSIPLPASPCTITFQLDSSNDGCTMFRGSVKSTGYQLHSPVCSSLSLPCVTVCHHISTGLYLCSVLNLGAG